MVNIMGYDFEKGYPLNGADFNDVAGIYIIYTLNPFKLLDVGETFQLKTRLANHERKLFWFLHSRGQEILIAFHHEPVLSKRLLKEKILRSGLNPLCGER